MGSIHLKQVVKRFGDVEVIPPLDLQIEDGEFVVFVGPSGCGKSTLLRLIAGLEDVTSGTIEIDGQDATSLAPAKRGLAMVFQSYALYPHMTVYKNIAFPLKMAGIDQATIEKKVADAAKVLNLTEYLDRRPGQLSGGQRQRVAIGRAIVREPSAFLFDEPLSNLDAALRVNMRLEISELHHQLATTMIYVTHDQVEAMSLADRIVVMHEGVLQQVGSPTDVYSKPENLFVAQFVGSPVMNVADVSVSANGGGASVTVDGASDGFAFPADLLPKLDQAGGKADAITLGVRPEGIHVEHQAADGYLPVEAHIIEPLGSYDIVDLQVGSLMLRARTRSGYVGKPGEKLWARIDPAQAHFFNTEDGRSLGVAL